MVGREYFSGASWTESGQARIENFEQLYQAIQPYIEQTERWRAGMKYRFCPEMFPLNPNQLERIKEIGSTIGQFFEQLCGFTPIGFRLDLIQDEKDNLWVNEIQTDDRGLPEMSILRNAYGSTILLEGVVPLFLNAIRIQYPLAKSVIIVFPDDERYYYASTYDFARLCRGYDPTLEVWAVPKSETSGKLYNTGDGKDIRSADVAYDYTGEITQCFQPVTKKLLADLSEMSVKSIPETTFNTQRVKRQEEWVIKPVEGRWSQGVIFGINASNSEWKSAIENVRKGFAVAQRFIFPKVNWLPVRTENRDGVTYPQEGFFLRLEGYFFLSEEKKYELADIMVTGREELPVHGQRDCIMVPAKLV